jgi:hypothetical protein
VHDNDTTIRERQIDRCAATFSLGLPRDFDLLGVTTGSFGGIASTSGLRESGHGWAVYEYTFF